MPFAPGGGGGGAVLDTGWQEITGAGAGSLNNPNSRVSDLAYTSGAWQADWLATTQTDGTNDGLVEGPNRRIPLSAYTPEDFSWETHALGLLVRLTNTSDLGTTTPFLTGLGVGFRETNTGNGLGIGITSFSATNNLVHSLTSTSATNITFNTPIVAFACYFQREPGSGGRFFAARQVYAGTNPGITSALVGNSALAAAVRDDMEFVVAGSVRTGSTIAAVTSRAKIYTASFLLPEIQALTGLPAGPS